MIIPTLLHGRENGTVQKKHGKEQRWTRRNSEVSWWVINYMVVKQIKKLENN
jgi:hypothetical protein